MAVVDDFLNKFHHIDGTTLADRQKNFFKLLHEIEPLVKDDVEALDAISSNLNPRNYLESLFKADFLIFFKRSEELLNLLKEGNDIFVSKIVKQIWFFKEVLGEVPTEQLINEILPCMSFSVRMKVLRKLCRYCKCENFEEIFDSLINRYGIYLASQFITGCSPTKIRQVLLEYSIKLTSTQLRIMYGKDPELIDFYFSHTKNSFDAKEYKNLIKLIYSTDIALFDNLRDKYKLSTRLGRRATKKFVSSRNNDVINNPYKFDYLTMKAVFRKIGKDSVQLFINALPDQIQNCFNRDRLFQSFPKRYHYSLFINIFQTHYKINFVDYPELIERELLKLIPNSKERAVLAKVKVDVGEDDYVKYLAVEEAIKLIKEKINLTSCIYGRAVLIEDLIEMCDINNDINALSDVLKYLCIRHKNDDLCIHTRAVNAIEYRFGFRKFTEQMWASLTELLTFRMLKTDHNQATHEKLKTTNLLIFTSNSQKLAYLEFLFKNKVAIDNLIIEYFTMDYNAKFPNYKDYHKNFVKYFLTFTINEINPPSSNPEYVVYYCNNIFQQIHLWNSYYKDEQLSFFDFPVLLEKFNHAVRNCKYWRSSTIFELFFKKIFTTGPSNYRNEYLQIYLEYCKNVGVFNHLFWFLKHEPLLLSTHLDSSFSFLFHTKSFHSKCLQIWKQIKKYSHLQLDEKTIQCCLKKLSDESSIETKSTLVPVLSVLMKPGDFSALADTYKPENKKLDLNNEKEVKLYDLQCSIGKCFKNTNSHEVLPSLLNYCVGDYFKDSIRSLYSLLYRTPENELPRYLNYLSKKAVSVRKHALYMTCELCTSTKVEHMLQMLNKKEEDLSLQKRIFSATIQYFVKNPTDSLFGWVKTNMQYVNRADEESLKSITEHLPKIPQKYKAQYILHAWEHLEKTVEVWEKLSPLKEIILGSVKSSEFPLEFGIRVIQQHFMTESRDLNEIYSFMFEFLKKQDEKQTIFETIFALADQSNNKNKVLNFLRDWYVKVMNSKTAKVRKYMGPYFSYYEKQISFIENFADFMKIFFLKSKLQSDFWVAEEFAVQILAFFEELVSNSGPHIIPLFAKEMNTNLSFFIRQGTFKTNEFYYSLIRQRTIPIVAALLLEAVAEPPFYAKECQEAFYSFLRLVKSIEDVSVQVCLHYKFSAYLESEDFNSTSTDMKTT